MVWLQKMWRDVERGSIVWEKVKTLSPSKMVSVSCQDYPTKSGNDFAQITVRLHNLQVGSFSLNGFQGQNTSSSYYIHFIS